MASPVRTVTEPTTSHEPVALARYRPRRRARPDGRCRCRDRSAPARRRAVQPGRPSGAGGQHPAAAIGATAPGRTAAGPGVTGPATAAGSWPRRWSRTGSSSVRPPCCSVEAPAGGDAAGGGSGVVRNAADRRPEQSLLSAIVGGAERAQRRGEGWDALTYGLSGSVGPAVVAAIAAGSSALAALFGAGRRRLRRCRPDADPAAGGAAPEASEDAGRPPRCCGTSSGPGPCGGSVWRP